MKKMNRLPAMILVALLLFVTAGASVAEDHPVKVVRLGTSGYTMEAYESLTEEAFPEESASNGMMSYLRDDEIGLILEVYQYGKQDYPGTLADFVEQDAKRYGGANVIRNGEINGLNAGWYDISDPEGDFRITYLFLEDEAQYLVIGYIAETDNAWDEMRLILDSLKRTDE